MILLERIYIFFLKINHVKNKIITVLFYNIFLKKSSNSNLIISPILLSASDIYLGKNVTIRDGCRIETVRGLVDGKPMVVIGNNVNIEQYAHITCGNIVSIGDNTSLAANVTVSDIIHDFVSIEISPKQQGLSVLKTVIGNNCIINNNAVVLPGAEIGNHVIVAANSVVRSGLYPSYTVLAGIPAKIVKQYSFEEKCWIKIN